MTQPDYKRLSEDYLTARDHLADAKADAVDAQDAVRAWQAAHDDAHRALWDALGMDVDNLLLGPARALAGKED